LAKLGNDAKPVQIQNWVKAAFSVKMTADHVSNYKGKILRGETGTRKPSGQKKASKVKKPAARKAASPRPVTATSPGREGGKGITLQDVHTTRDLVGRVGANQLRSLLDLLAK